MNEQQQETLRILRVAAEQDQWNLCRENVRKLLPDVKQNDGIRIIIRQVVRFLSDFLNAHPEQQEIKKSIDGLNHLQSLEAVSEQVKSIHTLMEKNWDDPGVSNFRNALKKLARLQQFDNRSDEYFETFIEILSGTLMAILAHNWGRENLELWHRWFYRKKPGDFFILAKYFQPHPKTIELSKSLWIEIADEIEMALRPK